MRRKYFSIFFIPKEFWNQTCFIFACYLIAFLKIGAQSFFLCSVGNPHTLTLDIQDERILVRCRLNNDILRLDT